MTSLTARNCTPGLWVSVSTGDINLSVPLSVRVPGLRLRPTSARLEGQWGRVSEAGGGSTISTVKMFPFKIEIKRLEIKSFTSLHWFFFSYFFRKYIELNIQPSEPGRTLQTILPPCVMFLPLLQWHWLTLLCHFVNDKPWQTKVGQGEMTSPRAHGAGLPAL